MKKSIKGTKTEKNLMTAFAGESMAVNRYIYFAEAAKRDGYDRIVDLFLSAAEDEKIHARMFSRFFESGSVEITATFPAVPASDTKSNLMAAVEGENKTWTVRYPEFSRVAGEEGLPDVAVLFETVAASEKLHEEWFSGVLEDMEKEEK